MTSTTYERAIPLGEGESRAPGWWAMVWTIATEAALFAFLLFSFFYLGSQSRSAWPPDGPLKLTLSLPNTIILILSSVAYMWGERGIRAGNRARLRAGLLIAFVLGLIFIIIQGIEWSNQPFGARDQAFGSLFYTITGFHGAHVVVGLLMNVLVQIWAARGAFDRKSHLAVTNAGMYWHFVDIVWLFVFASLYISPRLG
ncbi:MAG TPA: cytochrome c oxidase subunit 3 [Ramlibacter sp.]|nr:cytochrome c oxidase subunit 3 [Ramlibacter sp.]